MSVVCELRGRDPPAPAAPAEDRDAAAVLLQAALRAGGPLRHSARGSEQCAPRGKDWLDFAPQGVTPSVWEGRRMQPFVFYFGRGVSARLLNAGRHQRHRRGGSANLCRDFLPLSGAHASCQGLA